MKRCCFAFVLFALLLTGCATATPQRRPPTPPEPTPAVASTPTYLEGLAEIPPEQILLIEFREHDSGCAVWEEPIPLYFRHQNGVLEIREAAPATLPAVGYYGETVLEIYGDTLILIEQLPFSGKFAVLSVLADGTALVEHDGEVRHLGPGEQWKLTSRQEECDEDRIEEVFTAVFNHGLLAAEDVVFTPYEEQP